MPRSIWKGAGSFGMVSIPIKLYTATDSKDVSFNLLHTKCHTRIKQQRYCPACDEVVEWNAVVRETRVRTGRVAVAKVSLRQKEQLCLLRPYDGTLALETMYYPDEIRS